jgi:serine/threonine protein kinase
VFAKLTDFGTSRASGESLAQQFTTGVGTPLYMAPEVLNKQPYDTTADVYSFGIVLAAQKEPYQTLQHAWDVTTHVLAGCR